MENSLSETAFLVKEETGGRLCWFTPYTEVGLYGHAALASAYVIFQFYKPCDVQHLERTAAQGRRLGRQAFLRTASLPAHELNREDGFGFCKENLANALDK